MADERYTAAYVFALLGGNSSPDVAAITKILETAGIQCDSVQAQTVIDIYKDRNVDEIIVENGTKLSNLNLNEEKKLFQQVEGIWWSQEWGSVNLRYALTYQAKPNDLFIVTYPRSGTTWMQNIVYNLRTGGQPFDIDIKHFFEQNPHLETNCKKGTDTMQPCGAIKTHLPKLEFDRFFEYFLESYLPFSSYFEGLRAIWEQRHYDNVLIVSCEEMRTDFQSIIHKIAHFINIVLDDERRSFEAKFIETIKNKTVAARRREIFIAESELKVVRTGEINNWNSFMTPEQSHRIYRCFLETYDESDDSTLKDYWSKY